MSKLNPAVYHPLLSTVLFVLLCASLPANSANERIEEVVVTAVERCGPWPIRHKGISDCIYPELKTEQLRTLKEARQEYRQRCLSCDRQHCDTQPEAVPDRYQRLICRRLFQTPRSIPSIQFGTATQGYLQVEFTYTVTAGGRITDITIVDIDSELPTKEVLKLIRRSAQATRFEPIWFEGRRVPLRNVRGRYQLE